MDLEKLITRYYKDLSANDHLIWKYIQNNSKKCVDLSAEELAKECNVSRTTILRLAKKISLNNFSDLKLYIRMYSEDLQSKDELDLDIICDNFHKIIEKFKKKNFTSICEKIYNAQRIFVYATGNAQKSEANEIIRIFLAAGKCFYELFDIGEVSLLLDTFTDKDLMIIISLSGETQDALDIAKKVKFFDIPTISLTRLKNNPLAQLCDENLYVGTTFVQGINNLNYETTTLFFILLEILFVKYMNYEKGNRYED